MCASQEFFSTIYYVGVKSGAAVHKLLSTRREARIPLHVGLLSKVVVETTRSVRVDFVVVTFSIKRYEMGTCDLASTMLGSKRNSIAEILTDSQLGCWFTQ